MRQRNHWLCALLLVGGLTACDEALSVDNPNQPERDRVLSTPADVEQFIANSYVTMHQGTLGQGTTVPGGSTNDALQPQLLTLGMENMSANANFGMALRSGVPRLFIDNSRGNQTELGQLRDWRFLHRSARMAAIGLARVNTEGFTLGSVGANQRARAFSNFVIGVSLGNLALVYDSAAIVSDADAPTQTDFPLRGYAEVMDSALMRLDQALAVATTTGAEAATALPATWLNADAGFTSMADFARLIRSYQARFRASVARTPEERAEVDWDQVIADATAGIQTDYRINMSFAAGWDVSWVIQHYLFANWHMTWQLIAGMADTSGNYNTWLGTSDAGKTPFVVVTRDLRFPRGDDRTEQIANSPAEGTAPSGNLYFRNRPQGDASSSTTIANSFYDHIRFQAFRNANRIGAYPVMTAAEIRLLAAEGHIRNGDFDEAAALIDVTRVGIGGLQPLVGAGIDDLADPVPGGAVGCIPKVPAPPAHTSAMCGNIMEAMKWEYRMETAYTGYGMWYFAGRGWGDLPLGTPLHFPVPYQELDARGQPIYNVGGASDPLWGAPVGTYGY
jgi:hypothetical protein